MNANKLPITPELAIQKLEKLSKLTSSKEVCQLAIYAIQEQERRKNRSFWERIRATGVGRFSGLVRTFAASHDAK